MMTTFQIQALGRAMRLGEQVVEIRGGIAVLREGNRQRTVRWESLRVGWREVPLLREKVVT